MITNTTLGSTGDEGGSSPPMSPMSPTTPTWPTTPTGTSNEEKYINQDKEPPTSTLGAAPALSPRSPTPTWETPNQDQDIDITTNHQKEKTPNQDKTSTLRVVTERENDSREGLRSSFKIN